MPETHVFTGFPATLSVVAIWSSSSDTEPVFRHSIVSESAALHSVWKDNLQTVRPPL